MTMHIKYAVQGTITSTDTQLLDQIQQALPDRANSRVANEYTESRTENEDGTETLSARMTFHDGLQGKAAAERLYEGVVGSDLAGLADGWSLRFYRTPEGAHTASTISEWYSSNPDAQPTNEEGESFVPNRWDPENHTLRQESG